MDPAPNRPMPDGVIPTPGAMPDAQVVAPSVPGAEIAPASAPEVPPPPPGPDTAIPGITPTPTPDATTVETHVEPSPVIGAPSSEPHLDSLTEPVAEAITPPEDTKAKMTQVFMGLNDALKGAGDNERLQEVILKAAQGVVDDITKKEGLPEGSAVIDSHPTEELPKAA